MLRLTDEALTSIPGYLPDRESLPDLLDWLDDLDQAWVCILHRRFWDPENGTRDDIPFQSNDNLMNSAAVLSFEPVTKISNTSQKRPSGRGVREMNNIRVFHVSQYAESLFCNICGPPVASQMMSDLNKTASRTLAILAGKSTRCARRLNPKAETVHERDRLGFRSKPINNILGGFYIHVLVITMPGSVPRTSFCTNFRFQ